MDFSNPTSSQLLKLQYDLVSHIGLALNCEEMLGAFSDKLFNTLSSDGVMVLFRQHFEDDFFCHSFFQCDDKMNVATVLKSEFKAAMRQTLGNVRSGVVEQIKGFDFYLFRLSNHGVMAVSSTQNFKPELVSAMLPVCKRLSQAVELAASYDEKNKSYDNVVNELNHSQVDRAFKERIIRTISKKIDAGLKAIDTTAHLSKENNIPEESLQPLAVLRSEMSLVADEFEQFLSLNDQAVSLDAQPYVLQKIKQRLLAQFSFRTRCKKVNFDVTIDELAADCIRVDHQKLYLILCQLIDNAIRNTDEGSVNVVISTQSIGDDNTVLNFKVTDTGKGLLQKTLTTWLNQELEQVGKQYDQQALGLRLAIVRKLVMVMGGTLHAKSILGKGTSFDFDLPIECVVDEDASRNSVKETQKIAIVAESNQVNQLVAARMLEREGYKVYTVSSGVEAVSLWEKVQPNLVLVDITMANMNGIITAQFIRQKEKVLKTYTPIVALATQFDGKLRDKCLQAGVDGFLSKPFTSSILHATIQNVSKPKTYHAALIAQSNDAYSLEL